MVKYLTLYTIIIMYCKGSLNAKNALQFERNDILWQTNVKYAGKSPYTETMFPTHTEKQSVHGNPTFRRFVL